MYPSRRRARALLCTALAAHLAACDGSRDVFVESDAAPADAAIPDAPDTAPVADVEEVADVRGDGALDARADDVAADAPDAELSRPFAYTVTLVDPAGMLTDEHARLIAAARAALDEWGRYVSGRGTLSVELNVMTTAVGRFAGASTTNVYYGPCAREPAPCTVVEEQAIHRLRTGLSNPASPTLPDIHIDMSPDYVRRELWFDPDPTARTATVPSNRLDAVSVFTHELGHGLGMTGFRSLTTFASGRYRSLYDDHIVVAPGALTFEGPRTVARFGPVPLTRTSATQNVYHYGDPSQPSPFDELLMNGIVYRYGHRYRVDALDVAIVADLGVPLRSP